MNPENQIMVALKEQFGAAFVMLESTITDCDEQLWQDANREIIISQVVFHTLFFIDWYFAKDTDEKDNFKGKLGDDMDMGKKIYAKGDLLDYLADLRKKVESFLDSLTIELLNEQSLFDWHGSSRLSSLLYNLRHIMLHVGALHVRLNAVGKEPLKWVSKSAIVST